LKQHNHDILSKGGRKKRRRSRGFFPASSFRNWKWWRYTTSR